MTHTPGPWAIKTNGNHSDGHSGVTVYAKCNGRDQTCAEIYPGNWHDNYGGIGWDGEEFEPGTDQEANARLIAAAPELLAALRAFMAIEDSALKDALDWNLHASLFNAAEAAIAKATEVTT